MNLSLLKKSHTKSTNLKVYINNRNYVTWPKAMVDKLQSQGHNVIIIDQASTYEPLLEYYESKPCEIIRLNENYGHRSPWELKLVDASDYYVVTDPDLGIEHLPDDWDQFLMEGLVRFSAFALCCGLSLEDQAIPNNSTRTHSTYYKDHKRLEPMYWSHEYPGNYYLASVDTTFAMYRPGVDFHFDNNGIRTGRPYTAYHLPWHLVNQYDANDTNMQVVFNEETYFYFTNTNKYSSSSLSFTPAIQPLIDHYERNIK